MEIDTKLFIGKPLDLEASQKLNEVFKIWKECGFWPKKYECYKNARKLTIDSKGYFNYCEGYVAPNIEYHAWNALGESLIDISIAPDGEFYTINGKPRHRKNFPYISYIYCGRIIKYDRVREKDKEVGHLNGGTFKDDGSERYLILKKKDQEYAKQRVTKAIHEKINPKL